MLTEKILSARFFQNISSIEQEQGATGRPHRQARRKEHSRWGAEDKVQIVKRYLMEKQIYHIRSREKHPQSNGKMERFHKRLK
jgi:transposase InsO family protein